MRRGVLFLSIFLAVLCGAMPANAQAPNCRQGTLAGVLGTSCTVGKLILNFQNDYQGFLILDDGAATIPIDAGNIGFIPIHQGGQDGFKLVLNTSNDRYPKDAATAQAVAQMWTRIGVRTEVEALPSAALAARTMKQDYSIGLGSWGSTSGEAGSALVNVVATFDRATGRGASNNARYSNPAIDALIDKALSTVADGPREALLREAVKMAMDDLTFIPLYNQINTWAFKQAVFYPARSDERTFAFEVVARQ